ncbi:MAG: hypothetical protein AAB270_09430 [Chloroflexota bacterium]
MGARSPLATVAAVNAAIASAHSVELTPEAVERLQRIPGFIRGKVKLALEAWAREKGDNLVTPELMGEVRERMGGGLLGRAASGRPGGG